MSSIRVLIADDHAIVREGIRHVFRQAPGFEVVAEAGNGEEAIKQALAEGGQQAVSGEVPVLVVDLLEPVQVEDHDRERS